MPSTCSKCLSSDIRSAPVSIACTATHMSFVGLGLPLLLGTLLSSNNGLPEQTPRALTMPEGYPETGGVFPWFAQSESLVESRTSTRRSQQLRTVPPRPRLRAAQFVDCHALEVSRHWSPRGLSLPNRLVNDFHVLQGGIEFIRLLVCPKSYEMVE